MKVRCLLVDDEPPALKVLVSHISNINGFEIVGQCKNAIEALEILQTKTIDLIFLDIKMPKILGTDFLRTLSHPPKVIFVTAYDHYAVEGYDLDTVDYLVKPVSFERFLKAVTKVKRLVDNETTKRTEEYIPNPEAFVYLKVDKHMQKVLINDIEYIEGWKHYIKVFLAGGRHLLVKESITAIENLLSEHKFLRVHRSYIVSMNRISGYNGLSVLVNSAEIPIGRLYKQEVMKVINSK